MPNLPKAGSSRALAALIHASIGKLRSVCPAPGSEITRAGRPCFRSIYLANSYIMAAPVRGAPIASLTVVRGAKTLPCRRLTSPRADGRSRGP